MLQIRFPQLSYIRINPEHRQRIIVTLPPLKTLDKKAPFVLNMNPPLCTYPCWNICYCSRGLCI